MPSSSKTVDKCLIFDKREFSLRSRIQPYVCSTYHDFIEEHTVLTTKVFPELHSICKKRLSCFSPIHLPFNNKNESAANSIYLRTVLNHIHQCAPFFICLLGEKYGQCRDVTQPLLRKQSPQFLNKNNNSKAESGKGNDAAVESSDKTVDSNVCHWWDKNLCTAYRSGNDWVLDDVSQRCSVIELQVTEAAFREKYEYCRFYFRQPEYVENILMECSAKERKSKLALYKSESDYTDMKVRELKQKIVKKGHGVKYYETLEELCNFVMLDWMAIIDIMCPPLYDNICISNEQDCLVYKDWLVHETFLKLKSKDYILLQEHLDLLSDLTQFALTALDKPPEITDSEAETNKIVAIMRDTKVEYTPAKYTSIYAVVGDRGSGKTSLISHWVEEMRQEYGFLHMFTHFIGSDDRSTKPSHIIRRCLSYFSSQLQHNLENLEEDYDSPENLTNFGDFFTAGISHEPCIIVLDGLEDLGNTTINPNSQGRDLEWLSYPLPPHVRVIVTTCTSDISYQKLMKRPDTKILEMSTTYSKESKFEILDWYLGSCKNKLSQDHKEAIFKHRLSEKPLYLALLGAEMKDIVSCFKTDHHLVDYLESLSGRHLISRVVYRWLDCYSWLSNKNVNVAKDFGSRNKENIRESSGWVAEILRLLAVSKNGLTRQELLVMLFRLGYRENSKVSILDLMTFISVAKDFVLFSSSTGLLQFKHLYVRDTIAHLLLSTRNTGSKGQADFSVVVPKKHKDGDKQKHQVEKYLNHKALANFFFSQKHSDRKVSEIPWQLLGCKDYTRLKQTLCHPSMLIALYDSEHGWKDLVYFWKVLQQQGHSVNEAYVHMTSIFAHDNEIPHIEMSTETMDQFSQYSTEKISYNSSIYSNAVLSDSDNEDDENVVMADKLCLIIGKLLADLELYHEALKILMQLHLNLSHRFPLEKATHFLYCEVLYNISSQLLQIDMLDDSAAYFKRTVYNATDILTTLPLSEEQEFKFNKIKGKALKQLASINVMKDNKVEAERVMNEARIYMAKCSDVLGEAELLLVAGILQKERAEYSKADKTLKHTAEVFERWYGKKHHKVADVFHEYAGLLSDHKNTHRLEKNQAQTLYRNALKLREAYYGKSHLIVAETLFELGKLLSSYSDSALRKEAVAILRRAHDIRTTKLGLEYPNYVQALKVLNNLEISLQYQIKSNKYTNSRSRASIHSTMTWHDEDFAKIQQLHARQKAQKQLKQLSFAVKAVNFLQTSMLDKKDSNKEENEISNKFNMNDTKGSCDMDTSKNTKIGQLFQSLTEELGDSKKIKQCDKTPECSTTNKELALLSEEENDTVADMRWASQSEQVKHIDNYSVNLGLPRRNVIVKAKLLRPQSAPLKLNHNSEVEDKYRKTRSGVLKFTPVAVVKSKSVIPHAKREISSAPQVIQKYSTKWSEATKGIIHKNTCNPPSAFAVETCNTVSVVNGPQTGTSSLIEPDVPRYSNPRVRHTSAWYHERGRYLTPECPYPSKRNQSRVVNTAQKKLLKTLRFRNETAHRSSIKVHNNARFC